MAEAIDMIPVYAIASNVTSAMGLDTAAHWKGVAANKPGVKQHIDESLSASSFWASKLDPAQWQYIQAHTNTTLTAFEQLAAYSVQQALQTCDHELDPKETLLILSTTKGNIELLDRVPDERIALHSSAALVAAYCGFDVHNAVVVSHACVSGVVSLTYGLRLLQGGRYKNVIVVGCDRFTGFVLNGFQSFHAIADEQCKPFDAERKGINLGEAAATIILSVKADNTPMAQLYAGATSNDANHISGPSRTGEELSDAINRALAEANVTPEQISMVSAHGTATLYNDEMEAKAFGLSGLVSCPVHSFKGYTGHTLGAAGVLESAMIIQSLRHQQLIPSAGFENIGVSEPLNITQHMQAAAINYVLKTASGFGGCNAAAVWGLAR